MDALPNEILIECFSYLDALDIFYSFDGVNSRFSKLICDIPLYIDFHLISTAKYCQICLKLLSDPEIKRQIYSLKLTNQNIYQQQIVKSASQIDGFVHLRSLCFFNINVDIKTLWNINFSTLSQLISFHMIDSFDNLYENLHTLPMSQIQNLTVPTLDASNDCLLNTFTTLTSLTLSNCLFTVLHRILKYTTNLKHLQINRLSTHMLFSGNETIDDLVKNNPLNFLKHLTINSYNDEFIILANILKRMPNLTMLTLIDYEDEKLFNVDQWQCLIRSSLTKLQTFNFTCEYSDFTDHNEIQTIFQQLQTDFWLNEHQWYTDCILSDKFSTIYTIPYPYTSYTLPSFPDTYFNQTIDRSNPFTKVEHLEIHLNPLMYQYSCYFPYLTSIKISQLCLDENYFNLLKTIVNFTNINNLSIASNCKFEQPLILLEIVKQSSNLSTLSIHHDTLLPLLVDDQLCAYLSKMIKKLVLFTNKNYEDFEIYGYEGDLYSIDDSIKDLYQTNKLWTVFENIEQLECTIQHQKSIRFVLESLPKLSHINLTLQTQDCPTELVSFAEHIALRLGMKIDVEMVLEIGINLSIWIHR